MWNEWIREWVSRAVDLVIRYNRNKIQHLSTLFVFFFKPLSFWPNEQTPCLTWNGSARFSATLLCGQHQSEHPPACLPAHQPVRPAGCQPRKQSRWPSHRKSTMWKNTRLSRIFFFSLGPKSITGLCVALSWLRVWKGGPQIIILSDIALKRLYVHKLVWLSRCTPPLTPLSRQRSDQPCVVFSDGAWTWSLSRGNGLFSLPGLHKEPHCFSPHIPHWLPIPGFELPGWSGLKLQEQGFFFSLSIFLSKSQGYSIAFSIPPIRPT